MKKSKTREIVENRNGNVNDSSVDTPATLASTSGSDTTTTGDTGPYTEDQIKKLQSMSWAKHIVANSVIAGSVKQEVLDAAVFISDNYEYILSLESIIDDELRPAISALKEDVANKASLADNNTWTGRNTYEGKVTFDGETTFTDSVDFNLYDSASGTITFTGDSLDAALQASGTNLNLNVSNGTLLVNGEKLATDSALSAEASARESADKSLASDIASNESAIESLEDRMDSAEKSITTNTSDIASLTTRVSTNETNISTNTANITTLRSDVDALQLDFVGLENQVTVNTNAIASLQSQIDAISSSGGGSGSDLLDSDNTWTGSNNFTGGLQSNGVDVATTDNVVDLTSSQTITGHKAFSNTTTLGSATLYTSSNNEFCINNDNPSGGAIHIQARGDIELQAEGYKATYNGNELATVSTLEDYAKTSDLSNYVDLTSAQTITGQKTFTSGATIAKSLAINVDGNENATLNGSQIATLDDLTGYVRLDEENTWTARQTFKGGVVVYTDESFIVGISGASSAEHVTFSGVTLTIGNSITATYHGNELATLADIPDVSSFATSADLATETTARETADADLQSAIDSNSTAITDLQSASANYVDLTSKQTITGRKTFSDYIVGNGTLRFSDSSSINSTVSIGTNITINGGNGGVSISGSGVSINGGNGGVSISGGTDGNEIKLVGSVGGNINLTTSDGIATYNGNELATIADIPDVSSFATSAVTDALEARIAELEAKING